MTTADEKIEEMRNSERDDYASQRVFYEDFYKSKSLFESAAKKFYEDDFWQSRKKELKETIESQDLPLGEDYVNRLIFEDIIDSKANDLFRVYLPYGREYAQRIASGVKMLGRMQSRNSFRTYYDGEKMVSLGISMPTMEDAEMVADSIVKNMFGEEREKYIAKHMKELGIE